MALVLRCASTASDSDCSIGYDKIVPVGRQIVPAFLMRYSRGLVFVLKGGLQRLLPFARRDEGRCGTRRSSERAWSR